MSTPTDNEEFEKWWQDWLVSIAQRRDMPHSLQPLRDVPAPDSDSIPSARDCEGYDC